MSAVVYDPPSSDFPHLAVFKMPDGKILAEPVSSVKEGEAFIDKIVSEYLRKQANGELNND
ncbi:hypothetical protein [Acinetobacter sp. 1207_04]|uniref:hypothetical protein n=1 Tax=Acinetobacter sp. 1207_04 TaxID=2604449 RepID=UPI00405A20DA